MRDWTSLKATLKRGALVTAANWPVVVVQFVAESTFKVLLGVPVVGGALLVALALGRDLQEMLGGDLRDVLVSISDALTGQPWALASFVASGVIVAIGGATIMFYLKGGTVSVLARGEAQAGPVEQPPVRLSAVRGATAFSVPAFLDGSRRFFRRYLRLGFFLFGVYGLSGGLYLTVVLTGYRLVENTGAAVAWTLVAALASSALVVWIVLVNLVYLLVQMTVVVDDCGVRRAARHVLGLLGARPREVGGVVLVVLGLVLAATVLSVLATAGLGLISFVPLVGLAVLPLQAAAWLVRGFVFQYLGLTALGAYLALYRPLARPSTEAARMRTAS